MIAGYFALQFLNVTCTYVTPCTMYILYKHGLNADCIQTTKFKLEVEVTIICNLAVLAP